MKTTFLTKMHWIPIVASLCIISCEQEESVLPVQQVRVLDNIDMQVYQVHETPLGKNYLQWIDRWLHTFPANSCDQAGGNHNGSYVSEIDGVYFLANAIGEANARNITVAPGKAIFFPIVNKITTSSCTVDAVGGPIVAGPIQQLLDAEEAADPDEVIRISVMLDDLPYLQALNHRFVTDVFNATNNITLRNCFDACINTPLRQDAVSDGYWVMLKGLTEGEHVLTIKGEVPKYEQVSSVTYHILAR